MTILPHTWEGNKSASFIFLETRLILIKVSVGELRLVSKRGWVSFRILSFQCHDRVQFVALCCSQGKGAGNYTRILLNWAARKLLSESSLKLCFCRESEVIWIRLSHNLGLININVFSKQVCVIYGRKIFHRLERKWCHSCAITLYLSMQAI